MMESTPSRLLLFSSYSEKFPSNQYWEPSSSKARIWVQILSRNQRSWLITTTQPAKSRIASSSA